MLGVVKEKAKSGQNCFLSPWLSRVELEEEMRCQYSPVLRTPGFPRASGTFRVQVCFEGKCLGLSVAGAWRGCTCWPQRIHSVLLVPERRGGQPGDSDSGARVTPGSQGTELTLSIQNSRSGWTFANMVCGWKRPFNFAGAHSSGPSRAHMMQVVSSAGMAGCQGHR